MGRYMAQVPKFFKGRLRCRLAKGWLGRRFRNGFQSTGIYIVELCKFLIAGIKSCCLFEIYIPNSMEFCNLAFKRLSLLGERTQVPLILPPETVETFRQRPSKVYCRFLGRQAGRKRNVR